MCLQMFLKLYWPIIIMLLKLLTNMCSFFLNLCASSISFYLFCCAKLIKQRWCRPTLKDHVLCIVAIALLDLY